MARVLRPAARHELAAVHAMLCAAVDDVLADAPDFAASEKARFSPAYLHSLARADAGYVLIVEARDGGPAGFILSVPEHGVLLLCWAYLKPGDRKGPLALKAIAEYKRLWTGRRFHKIICYARAGATPTAILGQRTGFVIAATLKQHIFGLDMLLLEHPLEKGQAGYAPPVSVGTRGRLAARLRRQFGW